MVLQHQFLVPCITNLIGRAELTMITEWGFVWWEMIKLPTYLLSPNYALSKILRFAAKLFTLGETLGEVCSHHPLNQDLHVEHFLVSEDMDIFRPAKNKFIWSSISAWSRGFSGQVETSSCQEPIMLQFREMIIPLMFTLSTLACIGADIKDCT